MTSTAPDSIPAAAFAIERWSASSGNRRDSRADIVIEGGARKWRAHAIGNGAVDALLRAVDVALAPVLGEGVELQTYSVHATGDGHDAAAAVTLTLRSRSDDAHAPAYPGRGSHENILEASLVAYVDAINRMLAHGNVDVAAIAPASDGSPAPTRADESETADHFMKMFNH
jgi:LeuA allosteric (dimerisation) domain